MKKETGSFFKKQNKISMRGNKIYTIFLDVLFLIGIVLLSVFSIKYLDDSIPNNLTINAGEKQEFDLNVPVLGTLNSQYIDSSVYVDFGKKISIQGDNEGKYQLKFKLFGLFDLKDINVNVVNKQQVIPLGTQTGIYVKTAGVLVVGTGDITDSLGNVIQPAKNKVKKGDYIVSADDVKVYTKAELVKVINESTSNNMVLKIRRNNEVIDVMIERVEDIKGVYKLGIWVRDDTQGIGTLTFVDDEGNFGALGHGISDVDTGELLQIEDGKIYKADIFSIIKGKIGTPGELVGKVMYGGENVLGTINKNTSLGIFGKMNKQVFKAICNDENYKYIDIAYAQEIKTDKATILCSIGGEVSQYEIVISGIDINDKGNKGITFKVTDKELIEKTGGIVQGLSGSPILQDGKIIGAVTHVMINDPTKGYGIFIENMLKNTDSAN